MTVINHPEQMLYLKMYTVGKQSCFGHLLFISSFGESELETPENTWPTWSISCVSKHPRDGRHTGLMSGKRAGQVLGMSEGLFMTCPTQQSHTLPQGWVAGGQDIGCPWHGCQLYCLSTRVCHNIERIEVESVKWKSKGQGRNNWKWNRKGSKLETEKNKKRH